MSILVHLEIDAKPECVSDLKQLLVNLFPDTRTFDGCIDISSYLNDNGHTFIFIENWVSKEHYAKYMAWREETGALATLGNYLQGPPTIRYFDAIVA